MTTLSSTISWFQSLTFSRTKELQSLTEETHTRITTDQASISRTTYQASKVLDGFVWDIVRFDASREACRRQWKVTKVLLMAAGVWQSFEDRESRGNIALHRSMGKMEAAWMAAAKVASVSFERAMELTSKISLLTDSLAAQQDCLNTAIDEWERDFSKAHEQLTLMSYKMENTTKSLHMTKRTLDAAEMYKYISDTKHHLIQGFFGAVKDTAIKERKISIFPNPVMHLVEVASSAAEAASKRGKAEYATSYEQEKTRLEAKMVEDSLELTEIQTQMQTLEANKRTYEHFKPQLLNWQIMTAKMGAKIHTLQEEMMAQRTKSMQISIKVHDVLAQWEVMQYSKVREDVLDVLVSVLRSIEEDGALVLLHGRRGVQLHSSLRLGTERLKSNTGTIESPEGETDDLWLNELSGLMTTGFYVLICLGILTAYIVDFYLFERESPL